MRALLFCGLSLWWTGCSIFNAPDRDLIPNDGGLDAMPDGGPGDGGPDGGPVGEQNCQNGIDDDGDQLTDCADFDCIAQPECCAEGQKGFFAAEWDRTTLNEQWLSAPSAALPRRNSEQTMLVEFEPDDVPRSIIARECIPLATGAELRFRITPQGNRSCDDDCREYTAIVWTPVTNMQSGASLLRELAIEIAPNGQLRVTRGNDVVPTPALTLTPLLEHEFTVQIAPGLRSGGRPTLLASISFRAIGGGDQTVSVLDEFAFTDQDQLLLESPGCEGVAGLRVAIEGVGESAHVGEFEVDTKRCVNPSQFQRPAVGSRTLMSGSSDLGFSDTWSAEGLGAPTLVSSLSGSAVRWDLMVESTDVDPDLGNSARIGYALGHAQTTVWDSVPWTGGDDPKLGDDPPSCLVAPCPDGLVSLREPHLLARLNSGSMLSALSLTFAREVDASTCTDCFDIHVAASVPFAPATAVMSSMPLVQRAQVPGDCRSLRDPSAVPAGDDTGYWVFFTCERLGQPSEIHAIFAAADWTVDPDRHQIVIRGDQIGAFAEGGVRGPEALVETRDNTATLRLWFVSRSRAGETSFSFAQAQAESPIASLPALEPYPGNPVLRANAAAFGGCPGDDCPLHSLAVVRDAEQNSTLRFVVARRVNTNSATSYELVPLEQFLRLP